MLIRHIDLLPVLFEKLVMPTAVLDELANSDAPLSVQSWIATPPHWVEVRQAPASFNDASLASLDGGEKAAIALTALHPEHLLLMDDREGVVDLAARRDLVDLAEAFERLRYTTFR